MKGGKTFRVVQVNPSGHALSELATRLSGIAWAAKVHWNYPPTWMEAWQDSLTIQPVQIRADEYFIAVSPKDREVGFCAVSGPAEWWLEHLWVLPEWQGCGVGRQLFQSAVDYVREWGGGWFDLHCDPNAEGFYLRMGAVRVGEVDATMFGIPRVTPELRYDIA